MNFVPFLIGPTGIGKTEISLQLAEKLPIEIVSADSRQIYRYLDIGTAKPSTEILHKIMYGREARKIINRIFNINKIPLVVGGSGFYIQALIDGLSEIEVDDQQIRQNLQKRLDEDGVESLYHELESTDPDLANNVKLKDKQRIMRGLEVYYATGKPLSKLQSQKPSPADFHPIMIGLNAKRDFLYHRINMRVDEMIKMGLVDEVSKLKDKGFSEKHNALNSVGYKEVFDYLNSKLDQHAMIEKIKINSRRYAKRQLTWFRRDDRINWINIDEFANNEELMAKILAYFSKVKSIH
jgi:tRNA dimethylallyltransferase